MAAQHLRRPLLAATVEFLAHTLCGCPSHPFVACTKTLPNPKHHNAAVIFSHFACACCLLAACLLLLAKPVRSTLDTKKVFRTKCGCTNLVTLALTLARIEYCDQAGGARNIV